MSGKGKVNGCHQIKGRTSYAWEIPRGLLASESRDGGFSIGLVGVGQAIDITQLLLQCPLSSSFLLLMGTEEMKLNQNQIFWVCNLKDSLVWLLSSLEIISCMDMFSLSSLYCFKKWAWTSAVNCYI